MRNQHLNLHQLKRIELDAMSHTGNIALTTSSTKRNASKKSSIPELSRSAFFVSISNHLPELVSSDGALRIPLQSLDSDGLVRAKNLAHNQYVKAMISQSEDLDVHRATLNFLSKAIEKVGNPIARPHVNRSPIKPERTSSRTSRSKTIPPSKAA